MKRTKYVAPVLAFSMTFSLLAQEKGIWRAASTTASGITGDIALSDEKLSINFARFTIAQIRTLKVEEVTAVFADGTHASGNLYRLSIPANKVFLHKNTLCGTEETQWMVTSVAGKELQIAFFSGASMPVFTAGRPLQLDESVRHVHLRAVAVCSTRLSPGPECCDNQGMRSTIYLPMAAVLLLALTTGCHSTPPPTPLAQLNQQQMRGHAVFQARCSLCHNDREAGPRNGPSLLGVFKKPALPSGAAATDERVTATVLHGRNNMPRAGQSSRPDRSRRPARLPAYAMSDSPPTSPQTGVMLPAWPPSPFSCCLFV